MTEPPTREELTNALAYATAGQIAHMVTLAIGLAAGSHPEEIRKALASVFDLHLVEDAARRAMAIVTEAQMKAREIEEVVREMKFRAIEELTTLEKRIESLNVAIDELESRNCPY